MIGVRVGGHAELPPVTSTDNLNSQTQETLDMRPLMLTLALILGSMSVAASAADLEFEMGPSLFEKQATEKPTAIDKGSSFRIAIEDRRSFDSPLYEGLWPMTLEAFRGDPRILRQNFDLSPLRLPASDPRRYEPLRMAPPAMPVAANLAVPVFNFAGPSYDHTLYDGLWPMTLSAFRRLDEPKEVEVFSFSIAANN